MTETEKFAHLLKVLKEFAERKHCYNVYGDDYSPSYDGSYDTAFEDGAEYGEILFARTLLEQIGVEFQYPVMKEND
jgi:DNA-binding Lrp family transcriptional regulator